MPQLLSILFLITVSLGINDNSMDNSKLRPCPNSPNCVSTQETRKRKKMEPISFTKSPDEAIKQLEKVLATFSNATLISKKDNYFHYEFKTRIGRFIDDIEFIVDRDKKEIHFRSASRVGYGDFGKNKRRMKKVRKRWELEEHEG